MGADQERVKEGLMRRVGMRTEEGKATNKVGNWSFTSSGNQRRAHNAEFSPPFPAEGPGARGLYPITQSSVWGCSQKMAIL